MPKTKLQTIVGWNEIDWQKCQTTVFKLQRRIYQASKDGDTQQVHKLQKTLLRSWNAKLLAVRTVTQDDQGKNTAGVDGVKSITPKQRVELAMSLELDDKARPARRVYIPKANGEKRPLGIPTIEDRAKQALAKLALEAEWEAKFEPNSYGFRPGRSCHDSIEAIFLTIRQKPKYVLDADISKCFDRIDHNSILEKMQTFPTLRKQIKAWLKSGYVEFGDKHETERGTPQGGVISPLLANIALHGMETVINNIADSLKGKKRENRASLSLIRYADDFVILHKDREVVEKCKEEVINFLANLGLELSEAKTNITHTLINGDDKAGFDFLGFNIVQYPISRHHAGKDRGSNLLSHKTIIAPSEKSKKKHYEKLAEIVEKHKSAPQEALIQHLNPVIRGWCNYYRTVCAKTTFSKLDHLLYEKLEQWATRRHPNKGAKWVKDKYWRTDATRNWIFSPDGQIQLIRHDATDIIRHTKVKGEATPYNGDWIYWATRRGEYTGTKTRVAKLIKWQKGRCSKCNLYFRIEDVIEVDHIVPTNQGGKDTLKNLQLLHRECHVEKTRNERQDDRNEKKNSVAKSEFNLQETQHETTEIPF
jgi:RNA-directed DNA polymerase